jgi:hypothetical protein
MGDFKNAIPLPIIGNPGTEGNEAIVYKYSFFKVRIIPAE